MSSKLYIERIDIGAFGGISQKSVSFTDGVNLLSAKNESGKSTLVAALRFALYGFKGRSTSIAENPKKMYMPWSGAAASVAVTVGGSSRLRIERTVQGTKEQALCTDLVTGKALYTGLCFGEELFGISAETFEKTLFFSTLNPPESKDTELASALQNLVFSADEQIGTEKAAKILSAHKNALKGRNAGSGELYKLELEEQQLEEKLLREKNAMQEISALEAAAEHTESAVREREEAAVRLEAEKHNLEKYRAACALNEYEALKTKAAEAKSTLEASPFIDISLEKIEECRVARENKNRAAKQLVEARQQYSNAVNAIPKEDLNDTTLISAQKKHKNAKTISLVLLVACLLLCVVGACGMLILSEKLVSFAAIGIGAFFGILAVCMAVSANKAVKKAGFDSVTALRAAINALPSLRAEREGYKVQAENAQIRVQQATAEYESARRVYSALVPSENDSEVEEMYAGYVQASNLRVGAKAAADAVASFETINNVEELTALAVGAIEPTRPREQIETEYRFATQSAAGLKDKLNDIKNKLAILKASGNDPCATESALIWTRSVLSAKRTEHSALALALEELEAASNEMRSSISPRIASIAGNYFALATGGKYKTIELDTRLYMSYESESGIKSAEHLSAGTRETAYICLRLALIKLIYGEKSVPIVLDDAFAHTDDSRLKSLVDLLCQSGNQVIITSCTDREEKALSLIGARFEKTAL